MDPANTLLAISILQASIRTAQELADLLQRVKSEGRDVTDEEIEAYKLGNDSKSAKLIGRLRSSGVG